MDRPRMARRTDSSIRTAGTGPVKFWNIRPAAKGAPADTPDELWIYDEIGMWGLLATEFAAELAQLKSPELTIRVNSPGGDVFDGLAIKNLLADHPAHKTVKVDALAASIASVIAQAGDKVIMGNNAQMMIHDASGFAMGNADDMREMADILDMISDNIADVYAARAGGDAADWRKIMKGEQWYTGQEAVNAGLADEMAPPPSQRVPADAACPDCGGTGEQDGKTCPTCGGSGTQSDSQAATAARLHIAAQWCARLFPGHEQTFESAVNALVSDTIPDGVIIPISSLPGDASREPSPGRDIADDDSDAPDPRDAPEVSGWEPGLFADAVRSGLAPPRIDLPDWRACFADMPDVPRREAGPVDLGPAPLRVESPPEPTRNILADLISAAVRIAVNNRPEPDAPIGADNELPEQPFIRLDVKDLRRAVREARY